MTDQQKSTLENAEHDKLGYDEVRSESDYSHKDDCGHENEVKKESGIKRRRISRLFSFSLRTILLVTALVAIGLFGKLQWDWQQKMATVQAWTKDIQNEKVTSAWNPPLLSSTVKDLTDDERLKLLEDAAIWMKNPKQQVAAIKLIVELYPTECLPVLKRVAKKARCPDGRLVALRLIGIHRDANSAVLAKSLLDSKSPTVRTGALDCLGLIHHPGFDVPNAGEVFSRDPVWMKSSPPIHLTHVIDQLYAQPGDQTRLPLHTIQLPDEVRLRIAELMLTGETSEERVSAAQALLQWQPEQYKFRFAEWGVWFNDGDKLKLLQSAIDEVPPFVHQSSDTMASIIAQRTVQMFIIRKPVVHLTVDRPLVVDMSVFITAGRPLFAYPHPDDFDITSTLFGEAQSLDQWNGKLKLFENPREGYPWLTPHHHKGLGQSQWGLRRNNSFQYSVGLRWQSLIVTPEKQKWMKPPEVELNEHHRWWQGLRKVPSSWISSRGESERFLYYDGPTVIKSPIIVSRDSDRIVIHSRKLDDFAPAVDSKLYLTQTPQFATQKNFAKHRHSIYIHVGGTESAANNSISGKIVKLQQEQTSISLEQDLPLTGSALESKLLELLVDYGLTNAEAMGLIETWHPQFFETPGERVITLLTPPDYDAMCRLQVHPRPTEIVRAGIILTELSPLE